MIESIVSQMRNWRSVENKKGVRMIKLLMKFIINPAFRLTTYMSLMVAGIVLYLFSPTFREMIFEEIEEGKKPRIG